ncbi:MAG: hypothetical protein R2844_11715 [Caldilineales bacterium]
MRQGIVRFILLVIVLLLIFGVYRLLTIEPIDAGAFFDPDAGPLVLVEPDGGDAAPLRLEAFEAARLAARPGSTRRFRWPRTASWWPRPVSCPTAPAGRLPASTSC